MNKWSSGRIVWQEIVAWKWDTTSFVGTDNNIYDQKIT